MTLDCMEFCQRFIRLGGRPLSFAGRPYLRAPYASKRRRLVIRASRQVEKSTFLTNAILHTVVTRPRARVLFVCPRVEQAHQFSSGRLVPAIAESPLIRQALLGKRRPQVTTLRLKNKSEIYIRAAFHNADAARGISADLLVVDEYQDIAPGVLPVLEATLSHAESPRVILTGTPKLIDNHLESAFRQTTANEFLVPCLRCHANVLLDERCLGPRGPICPECLADIDPRQGQWRPCNPGSTWGDGYWINHLMVPWVVYAGLLEKQRGYDPALFKNECLGLPTELGEHIVTRAELEACCQERAMATKLADVAAAHRQHLIGGLDWGGGGTARTVLAIGYMDRQYRFNVVCLERLRGTEEPEAVLRHIAARCEAFRLRTLAADGGGNGQVYNRLLHERLRGRCAIYAVHYGVTEQAPYQDGALWRWPVNRSASIGVLFGRIKKQSLLFPRLAESSGYLEEFACEIAEYDDVQRSVKYLHPEGQPDDTLHATNYALCLAVREFQLRQRAAA